MSAGPQIQTIWPFVFSPKQLLYLCFNRCLKKSKIYKNIFFPRWHVSKSRKVPKRHRAAKSQSAKASKSRKAPKGQEAPKHQERQAPKRQSVKEPQSAKGPRGTKASRAPSAKAPKRQSAKRQSAKASKRSGFEALRRRTRATAPKHPSVQALRL